MASNKNNNTPVNTTTDAFSTLLSALLLQLTPKDTTIPAATTEAPPSYSHVQGTRTDPSHRQGPPSLGGGSRGLAASSNSNSSKSSAASSSPPPSSAARSSGSTTGATGATDGTTTGASGTPSKSLHVRRLAQDVTEEVLTQTFEVYGPLTSVRLNLDRETGRSLGTAYVNFESSADAQAALAGLNSATISGSQIVVAWARPSTTQPQAPTSAASSSAPPSASASASGTSASGPASGRTGRQAGPVTTLATVAQPSPRLSAPSSRTMVTHEGGRGGRGGHGHAHRRENASVTTTQVTTRREEIVEGPPPQPPLMATFVIDVSGSMRSKVEAVLSGMEVIYNEVLEESDRLALFTFSTEPEMVHGPRDKPRVKWAENCEDIRAKVARGGGTALYSAVIECIKSTPNNPKFARQQREIIVLTDGSDNRSPEGSLETLRELMAHPGVPNMHIIIMGVGIDTETEVVLSGLCAPDHCTYLPVTASATAIEAAFQRAKQEQRERRRILITTTTTTTASSSSSSSSHGGGGGRGTGRPSHFRQRALPEGGASGGSASSSSSGSQRSPTRY